MERRRWIRITGAVLIMSCSSQGLTGVERPSVPAIHPVPELVPDPIAGWGDSLTNFGLPDSTYPSQLSRLLDRAVFNGGVSGETSSQILVRIMADTAEASDVEIYWMGRNNFEDPARVKADIAAAVAHMRRVDRHFVVMSILNGDYPDELAGTLKYNEILALNADLAALYPNNFVDIRAVLIGTSDVPPDSLRADELHMNAAGNRVVAATLAGFIEVHRW